MDDFKTGWAIALVEKKPDYRKYGISNESIKLGQMCQIVESNPILGANYRGVRYYAKHETHIAYLRVEDLRRPTNDEVMAVSWGEYVAIHGRIG